jgi:hypothetical protein
VTLALFQITSSRYSVWCLPYSRSQVHGILCDACLITVHEFTVFCVILALFQVKSWHNSVWCLSYYNLQVHGIPGEKFTVFCGALFLLQCISSQYSVWRLPYSRSKAHSIMCDACHITVHKFTLFCVMLALFQV